MGPGCHARVLVLRRPIAVQLRLLHVLERRGEVLLKFRLDFSELALRICACEVVAPVQTRRVESAAGQAGDAPRLLLLLFKLVSEEVRRLQGLVAVLLKILGGLHAFLL